jgi:hypothetical protein
MRIPPEYFEPSKRRYAQTRLEVQRLEKPIKFVDLARAGTPRHYGFV